MRLLMFSIFSAVLAFPSVHLTGQTEGDPPRDVASEGELEGGKVVQDEVEVRFNIPLKTAGGTQWWTDHCWRDGFRIQHNSLTGHWRLVDRKDVRRAWGTRPQCQTALDKLCPKPAAVSPPRHVIVLLHGLMRTQRSMKPMETALREAGYDDVIRVSYASTRSSISEHAEALADVLSDFPKDTRFSFVGHSMGNIVVRHLIGDLQRAGDPDGMLPRCGAMVMLGPPNQGAAIARRLAPTGVFEFVTGKGGMELGPEWDEFVKKLAVPSFPFAIIAGDISDTPVSNPLVDKSGDFVVGVEEAQLEGASEFHTLPLVHSFMMGDAHAQDLAIGFLNRHGVKPSARVATLPSSSETP